MEQIFSSKTEQVLVGVTWGKSMFNSDNKLLIEMLHTQINGPKVLTTCEINVPSRTLALVSIQVDLNKVNKGHIFDVQPNQ